MNKPVAWWTGEFNDEADDFMFDKTKQNHINHVNSRTHEFFSIPLYTHPVKELTDEEILQVMINVYSDTVPPIRGVEFAREILRKAQEK